MSNSQANAIQSTYEQKLFEKDKEIREIQLKIDILMTQLQEKLADKNELRKKLETFM